MTWEIVAGIIALAGFVATMATYASKQASVLSEVKTTLQALNETLGDLKENNRASHKDIYDKIGDHESRVAKIETEMRIHHGK